MILDYNAAAAAFILSVNRGEADPYAIMAEYGLDFSMPDSTHNTAILYTKTPYAAASFWEYATPGAAAQLGHIYQALQASSALTSGRHIDVPSGKELIPFQLGDCDYILSRSHALDADEPGLGKTPTSVAVANEIQAQRVCVVCMAGLREQWERRIREWTTMRNPFIYRVEKARFGVNPNANYTIISYELARHPKILRALTAQRFDLLIIDEARLAKTVGSGRSRAIFGFHDHRHEDDGESEETVTACLMDVSEKVLCLDGTPIPNRPSEAYIFCRNLDWSSIDWMSQKGFRERFNPQSKEKSGGKVYTNEAQGRLPELQTRLRSSFMCRHLEIDVRHQLKAAFPDPIYDLIYLEETAAVRAALEAEKMLDIDPETLAGADMKILGQVSTVRQQMGVAMAPQVADYLKFLLDSGAHKLVVFAWHKEVLDILCDALRQSWGVLRVDGSDSGQSKDAKVRAFIEKPGFEVICGNLLALGTGVDGLQTIAHQALFAEPDWVPGNNDQCVKRLARMGQMSRVMADFFMVRGSFSEKVLATSLRKGGNIHEALDKRPSALIHEW